MTDNINGWTKIREDLAKKFDVDITRIHGHHIVQNTIPKEYFTKKMPGGELLKNHDAVDPTWEAADQSAWYIGKSHELLKKAEVEAYSPSTSGIDADTMIKRLKNDLKNPTPGRSGANLTLALNDKANVHNVETHKAVYERLKKVEGMQVETEDELKAIGLIFRNGHVPRSNEKGWDYTKIDEKAIK